MWADGRKSRLAVALLVAAQAGLAGVGAQEAADPGVTIAERLERIENALSNQGLLEMVQQVQSLEVEINRLRGEMEVHNHALEQLKKRQAGLIHGHRPAPAAPGKTGNRRNRGTGRRRRAAAANPVAVPGE